MSIPNNEIETIETFQDIAKFIDVELGILNEICSIGAGAAATALSHLIERRVSINLPRIRTMDPIKVLEVLNTDDSATLTVYEEIKDSNYVNLLLSFKKSEARKLIEILQGNNVLSEDIDEKEYIKEVGSIIIGNLLNTISEFMESKILPIAPVCLEDMLDAIIDTFLAGLSMSQEKAVLVETQLFCGLDVKGTLIMFINKDLQNALIEKGREILSPSF